MSFGDDTLAPPDRDELRVKTLTEVIKDAVRKLRTGARDCGEFYPAEAPTLKTWVNKIADELEGALK